MRGRAGVSERGNAPFAELEYVGGMDEARIPAPNLAYSCPLRWTSLTPLDHSSRHCSLCDRQITGLSRRGPAEARELFAASAFSLAACGDEEAPAGNGAPEDEPSSAGVADPDAAGPLDHQAVHQAVHEAGDGSRGALTRVSRATAQSGLLLRRAPSGCRRVPSQHTAARAEQRCVDRHPPRLDPRALPRRLRGRARAHRPRSPASGSRVPRGRP